MKRAFDTVNQKKLCSILDDEVFSHESYVLQRYMEIRGRGEGTTTRWRTSVTPQENYRSDSASFESSSSNSVIIDRASHTLLDRDKIKAILLEHITSNTVRLHNTTYLQNVGIPQGALTSSLLFSLFYGHLERNGLADLIQRADSVLVRFIDDSLFISTNKGVAIEFLNRLKNQFKIEYGTELNENKTLINFDFGSMPRIQYNCAYPSPNPCLPWCGVLIDTVTLEIYGDYTRYRGDYLRDSVTVIGSGTSLRKKLKLFAMPKCVPLLLDVRINRPSSVHLNLYQIFLLCAMKFHCYVPGLLCNQQYLFSIIEDAVDFTAALAHSRLRQVGASTDHLSFNCVRYLGNFFILLFQNHFLTVFRFPCFLAYYATQTQSLC